MNNFAKVIATLMITVMLFEVSNGLSFFKKLENKLAKNEVRNIDAESEESHTIMKRSISSRRRSLINTVMSTCGPMVKYQCSLKRHKCHWLTKRSISTDEKNIEHSRVKRRARKSRGRRRRRNLHVRITCNTCRTLCW